MSIKNLEKQWAIYNIKTQKVVIGPHRGMGPITTKLNEGKRHHYHLGREPKPGHIYIGWQEYELKDLTLLQIEWAPVEGTEITLDKYLGDKLKAEKVKGLKSARFKGRKEIAKRRREGKL